MWYLATLGYTPEVLVDLRDAKDIAHVLLVHGDDNPEQRDALKKARVMLSMFKASYEFCEVLEPWNFRACFQAIHDAHAKYIGQEAFILNASGGTEVLNSAATLFAVVHGVETRYVDRHAGTVTAVDYGLLRHVLALEGTKRGLVDALTCRGGIATIQEISKNLGVSKGAVSLALRALEEEGVLSLQQRQRGRGKEADLNRSLWPLYV